MTTLRRGDADLHLPDGEHRSTPPTADGHQLELYDARIRRHLDDHKAASVPVPTLRERLQGSQGRLRGR